MLATMVILNLTRLFLVFKVLNFQDGGQYGGVRGVAGDGDAGHQSTSYILLINEGREGRKKHINTITNINTITPPYLKGRHKKKLYFLK